MMNAAAAPCPSNLHLPVPAARSRERGWPTRESTHKGSASGRRQFHGIHVPRPLRSPCFLILAVAAAAQPHPAIRLGSRAFIRGARLIAGGQQGGSWLAGIEITLDPGFKTYWRNPGDSGLPPRFDWSGSENVAGVDVRWPAPERHEDAAGVAYVYGDEVVLPVLRRGRGSGEARQACPVRSITGSARTSASRPRRSSAWT